MRSVLAFGLYMMLVSGVGWAQRGQVLNSPEKLAGRWEAPDGVGGAVGLNILVAAYAKGAVKRLQDETLYLDHLTVGVYRRAGAEGVPMVFNYFSDNAKRDSMMWDGKRLLIQGKGAGTQPKFDIDLVWDERAGTWTGHFELGEFSRNVVLRRPDHPGPKSPFVGAWSDAGSGMNRCLHVAQQSDGGLTAWADDLNLPGSSRYANGLRPPEQSLELYGEMAKVKLVGSDMITVELRAYSAGCCSHSFTAKLSSGGRELVSSWREERPAVWKKMPGNSCVAAVPGGLP